MSDRRIERLKKELQELKYLLHEREASLPAHSVKPHQILVIEDLEEKIAEKEKELLELVSH